mmetsp:Transcript_53052/g.133516  ORF Transcript_53052/g.133516 Transcript_53052/m.133516 type:complete len:113 (-) Transcript_53052:53-391(-)
MYGVGMPHTRPQGGDTGRQGDEADRQQGRQLRVRETQSGSTDRLMSGGVMCCGGFALRRLSERVMYRVYRRSTCVPRRWRRKGSQPLHVRHGAMAGMERPFRERTRFEDTDE